VIAEALQKLAAGLNLSADESARTFEAVADGAATATQVAALLTALRVKGESADEILGAARVMRARAERVQVAHPVFIDTCGTGGDGAHTFNISTAAAFVVAAAGVPVAKHGNRAVSSKCGSADVLAALGVDVDAPRETVERCIAQVGIGFLFAPRLHPAFKAVAPVRKELGFRTVFNLLGPLANPAGARHQVMGVFDPRWVPVVGEVLARLQAVHALVVHGGGSDEVSVTSPTLGCDVREGKTLAVELTPEALGLSVWAPETLAGGDALMNARIIGDVFAGQKGGPRDAVLANAGAGLYVGGAAASVAEGVRAAAKAVDAGHAAAKVAALVKASRS
jgi:anthranilate phosphoribosyltransferase